MGKKRVLGKKNALSNGTVVAFACNCVGGVCNIGCSCSGRTNYSTTLCTELSKSSVCWNADGNMVIMYKNSQ